MGALFDRYVVVDWSASGSPATGRDSIWIATVDADGAHPDIRCSNPPTRRRAEDELAAATADRSRRTLVAVDVSLGYPAGSAGWFGLEGDEPWRAMWCHLAGAVVDDDRNRNNRFEVAAALNRRGGAAGPAPGPFWGRPAQRPLDGLDARKPDRSPLPEFRRVEERLRSMGRRPASCWQLLGAGSVGGQSLTLIPVLWRLAVAVRAEVWPFTTGANTPMVPAGSVVVAETWPTGYDLELPIDRIRDEAQVEGVARRLCDADEIGALAAWFSPELRPADRHVVESEEGWVLLPDGARGEAEHSLALPARLLR